jgi:glycosyltransferase involved in cell wall biosynthesis
VNSIGQRTSVILPVHNGVRLIEEAIRSVLSQLESDDEIFVVDDASADATRSVIPDLRESRVRVLDRTGRGVSSARNIGLAAATGEYIAFLDHDDMWPRDRHRILIQALKDDPQLGAVFGRICVKFEPGAIPWTRILDASHDPNANLGTGLFRSNVLRRMGGFDETLRLGEDIYYFERLREAEIRFNVCDVDGLIYRRHMTNCTNDPPAVQDSFFDVITRKMARNKAAKPGASA